MDQQFTGRGLQCERPAGALTRSPSPANICIQCALRDSITAYSAHLIRDDRRDGYRIEIQLTEPRER
jgi:hypothetical protein